MSVPNPVPDSPFVRLLTHEFAPFRGGIATFSEEGAAALVRVGAKVEVWAPDYRGRFPVEQIDDPVGVRVRRFSASGRLSVPALANLLRIFHRNRRAWREGFSVWGSPGILWAALAYSRLTGWWPLRPPVAVFHGSEILKFQSSPAWRWLTSLFQARPLQLAGASGGAADLLRRMTWTLGQPVHRLVCACPTWLAQAAEANPLPRPEDGRINLLTLARLHPRKGHLLLAEALGRLPSPLRRQVRWIVHGDGDPGYRLQILQVAQQLDVDLECRGPVERSQMSQVYAAADLYALTSLRMPRSFEAFGITYLEAAMHSKPSVGFRTGGVAEAVLDGQTGLLVPEGDVPGLAHALETLLSDARLRQRWGKAARCHALGFRWEDTARTLLQLDGGG